MMSGIFLFHVEPYYKSNTSNKCNDYHAFENEFIKCIFVYEPTKNKEKMLQANILAKFSRLVVMVYECHIFLTNHSLVILHQHL